MLSGQRTGCSHTTPQARDTSPFSSPPPSASPSVSHPSSRSSNIPHFLQPQDLCRGCSLCLEETLPESQESTQLPGSGAGLRLHPPRPPMGQQSPPPASRPPRKASTSPPAPHPRSVSGPQRVPALSTETGTQQAPTNNLLNQPDRLRLCQESLSQAAWGPPLSSKGPCRGPPRGALGGRPGGGGRAGGRAGSRAEAGGRVGAAGWPFPDGD